MNENAQMSSSVMTEDANNDHKNETVHQNKKHKKQNQIEPTRYCVDVNQLNDFTNSLNDPKNNLSIKEFLLSDTSRKYARYTWRVFNSGPTFAYEVTKRSGVSDATADSVYAISTCGPYLTILFTTIATFRRPQAFSETLQDLKEFLMGTFNPFNPFSKPQLKSDVNQDEFKADANRILQKLNHFTDNCDNEIEEIENINAIKDDPKLREQAKNEFDEIFTELSDFSIKYYETDVITDIIKNSDDKYSAIESLKSVLTNNSNASSSSNKDTRTIIDSIGDFFMSWIPDSFTKETKEEQEQEQEQENEKEEEQGKEQEQNSEQKNEVLAAPTSVIAPVVTISNNTSVERPSFLSRFSSAFYEWASYASERINEMESIDDEDSLAEEFISEDEVGNLQ